eukprot:scaffold80485_cov65-Phaeocystis_antarctica.AAC.1
MKALFVKTTQALPLHQLYTRYGASASGMDRLQGRSPLHAPVASRERRHLLDSSYMIKGGEIGGFGGG